MSASKISLRGIAACFGGRKKCDGSCIAIIILVFNVQS